MTSAMVATAPGPGAVGVIQLHGPSIDRLLTQLTRIADWPVARLRVVDLVGIDRGLAVKLHEGWAQLMPHGGPRVMARLIDVLTGFGVEVTPGWSSRQAYPEARSDLEADMLACMTRAASAAAVDLLLAQPGVWRDWLDKQYPPPEVIFQQSDRLDRLINPPSVIVVGRPNVGKSTLTNRVLGHAASVVADLPGTTRDWVAGLGQLTVRSGSPVAAGVTVRWADTPGLRVSDDPIEGHAIILSRSVIQDADVLIAMCDPDSDWPDPGQLPREPDLWVRNKMDLSDESREEEAGDGSAESPLKLSALNGRGVDRLQGCILERLGLREMSRIEPHTPWAFSKELRTRLAAGDIPSLRRYVM